MDKTNQSLTGLALQKFRRNFWGVLSLGFIVVLLLISAFAYVLAPDKTQNANWGDLSIHSKSPGFTVTMLTIPSAEKEESTKFSDYFTGKETAPPKIPILKYSISKDSLTYYEYNDEPSLAVTKAIPLSVFGKDATAETIKQDYIKEQKFLLGTDSQGRDLLSRLIIGSRVSIAIGFVAVFISLVVGIFFGAIAGYYGGKVDAFVMWLVNIIWSIPTLLLVIAITLALGKGFWHPQVFSWVWDVRRRMLFNAAEQIAGLSAVDGCVLMDQNLALTRFGVKLHSKKRHDPPEELKDTGTRHSSAYEFCAEHKSVAFVVSQDGHLTVIASGAERALKVFRDVDPSVQWSQQ